MANARIIALFLGVAIIAGFLWHYVGLRADLSAALADNSSLSAVHRSNQAAIEALIVDKARAEEALAIEARSRKAAIAAIARIRKDIENAKADPACLAADDRDRALAYGLRNLLAGHHPD